MPYKYLEVVHDITKKQDLIQSIFEFVATKENLCLEDIANVKLPDKMCPFGCKLGKEKECPYDYDISKCPHNLDDMSLDELTVYLVKILHYDSKSVDKESKEPKKLPDDVLQTFLKYNAPGNYKKVDKWQNKSTE